MVNSIFELQLTFTFSLIEIEIKSQVKELESGEFELVNECE